MKRLILSMVAAAALMLASPAMAVDMPADGKAKCGACHAIDKKMVGPAWMDVSKKYLGDKDASSKIAANVTKGGAFGWKLGVMAPRGLGATDAQIRSLSEFIVTLAK